MSSFKLRPHHSLCIQFFEGKGYSGGFVKSMGEIINKLENENPFVTVVGECDEICKACPNNLNGKCSESEKVNRIDLNTLSELNLKTGDKLYWADLKGLAFEKIINKNKIESVCENCVWKNICNRL